MIKNKQIINVYYFEEKIVIFLIFESYIVSLVLEIYCYAWNEFGLELLVLLLYVEL
jgi:hypothetical protein